MRKIIISSLVVFFIVAGVSMTASTAPRGQCQLVNKSSHPIEVKRRSTTSYYGSNSTQTVPAGPFTFKSRKDGSGGGGVCPDGGRATIVKRGSSWFVQ